MQTAPVPDWMKKTIIRRARETDLQALEWDGVYSHFRVVYRNTFERAMMGQAVLWVAECDGEGIIGQVFIQLECDRPELANGKTLAYMFSFRIKPEYRGQGLGSRILEIIETDLQKRGFQYLTLNVAKENTQAISLYEKHGYQIVAHEDGNWSYPDEKGSWHQVKEPAWRMVKRLQ